MNNIFFSHEKSGGIDLYRVTGRTSGKESENTIVNTVRRVQAEVELLEDSVVARSNGRTVVIKHTVLMTMLDGKCR